MDKKLIIKKYYKFIIITIFIIGLVIYYYINKTNLENSNDQFNDLVENINDIENNNLKDKKEKSDKELENKNIIVYVVGEVNKQGIVEIKEGCRLIDVINKAGGITEKADLEDVNLATIIEDGMKIKIPSIEERANDIKEEKDNNKINKKKININLAMNKEFESLPGIGEEMAKRIVEYRNKKGKFSSIEDLKNIKGIGEAKFNKIKEYITLGK